jgi:hypothetical protein
MMSAKYPRRLPQYGAGTYDVLSTLIAVVEQKSSCHKTRVLRKEPVMTLLHQPTTTLQPPRLKIC